MKRIIAILMALAMLLALAGCNIRKKIGEKLVEEMLEQGGDAEVDIDGDTMTIEGEDGSTTTIGGTEWPDSGLAKKIPELKKGTVSYVMQSEESLLLTIDSVEEDDAKNYIDEVKEDFTLDAYEMNYDGGFSYSAKNDSSLIISVTYTDGTVMITACQETP